MHAVNDQQQSINLNSSSCASSNEKEQQQPLIHLLEPLNIVLVGDEGVGKSSCLITYSELLNKKNDITKQQQQQQLEYKYDRGCIPSVVETLRREVTIPKTSLGHCKFVNSSALDQSFDSTQSLQNCEGFTMNVNLIDTPGEEDQSMDRVQHYYPHANVFVLIFSINDITSFEKLADYWCKEIKNVSPHPCMMIVGNKSDVGSEERHVTRLDGLEMQNKIGAKMYMEISSTSGNNIVNMFDACVKMGTKELDGRCAHLLYKQNDHSIHLERRHHLHPETLTLNIPPRETLAAIKETPSIPPSTTSSINSSSSSSSASQKVETIKELSSTTQSLCAKITKQLSFGTPPIVEKEFRFGVELLPKIFLDNDPEAEVLKKLNFKIKKIVKVKIDLNMNPLCQIKRQIIGAFGKENPKVWGRKTEEQWLKTLKVQILDNIFNDYYDLDDWEQVISQKEDNIKLLVFY
ncbi:small GTPase [Naegleria gruberi]|uniref:Small GTPase n=1 Tax=Naegleria gruberi TaxID=5762 RepID=D2VCP3_NAEGR|nr:small GTPase [Naegleria gruberi]EFC45340.1 small GTPase [Naegleria gruberi]|eukprot:XP_002678084.1 small GTPase [Naegleria gruberi]